VSVEEFKKLLGVNENGDQTEAALSMPHARDEDEDAIEDKLHYRRMYASKIIAKFMNQDSFLDIASENMKILNKSVWSFGSFLSNDLMMCSALSSKVDLFRDAEVAVKKALQPSFESFQLTKQYREVLANARISYALIASGQRSPDSDTLTTGDEGSELGDVADASPARAQAYLTLPNVLANRRLCSVFWVFLFKERSHQQLSAWMDMRYQLLPVLDSFIAAANDASGGDDRSEAEDADEYEETDEGTSQVPGELIEQILSLGTKLCDKYFAIDASCPVNFVAEQDQELLFDFIRHVTDCLEAGSFSVADAEAMVRNSQRILAVIEYNLQVNDFVRFMSSDSFKSLIATYQSRLLSPSNLSRSVESPEDVVSLSTSSDSMTTLQELFHCMNVPSHQPQRIRSKKFSLKELFQNQLRGESQRSSLISSVLSFRLDTTNKDAPEVIKEELHTLAKTSDLRHHHALPDHVESFFCPSGVKVIRARERPAPKLFHMTIGNADKSFYGACLTRYVPQDDDSQLGPLEQVLRETEGLEVFIPVGICIVSRYPILNTLKKRLENLHVELQDDEAYMESSTWKPTDAQLEELLSPFDFSVAVNGSFTNLNDYVDFSMEELFNCLSIENVVALVTCMMLERQVVLVSSRYSVLTSVGETLKSLMSPLLWSHVFAPILPQSMLEALQCPTPFLFGVHSSYRAQFNEMLQREGSCDSIVVVDLDANSISSSVRPALPSHLRLPLVANLQQLLKPRVYFSDFVPMCLPMSPQSSRRFPESRVRECFRAAVHQLLHPFDEFRFVLSDDFDFSVVFDKHEFLRRVPVEDMGFYRSFLETQVFSQQIATVA
jgi:hypothetical protein